jgi:uncharacterized protein (DUF433 family)
MTRPIMRKSRGQPFPDPTELPAYRISEVARFLWISEKNLRRWSTGEAGRAPLIRAADPALGLLSFMNLAELHVLGFLRDQAVPLRKIRRTIDYLATLLPEGDQHPLLGMELATDGVAVFVEGLAGANSLVNVSQHGQMALTDIVLAHLKRIERDSKTHAALRLYPFPRRLKSPAEAAMLSRPIAIDPRVSFGRPVIAGTRVPTVEIFERWQIGEDIVDIAEDMRLELPQIEAALRYHSQAA